MWKWSDEKKIRNSLTENKSSYHATFCRLCIRNLRLLLIIVLKQHNYFVNTIFKWQFVKKCTNLTFKANFLCQKSSEPDCGTFFVIIVPIGFKSLKETLCFLKSCHSQNTIISLEYSELPNKRADRIKRADWHFF